MERLRYEINKDPKKCGNCDFLNKPGPDVPFNCTRLNQPIYLTDYCSTGPMRQIVLGVTNGKS